MATGRKKKIPAKCQKNVFLNCGHFISAVTILHTCNPLNIFSYKIVARH